MGQNLETAVSYYTALHNKDVAAMDKFLDPNVRFIGPLAQMHGKIGVLEAAKNFCKICNGINIRSHFVDGDNVMMVLDFDFKEPIGEVRSASMLSFKDNLIECIELFYDARPFETPEQIFSKG